MLKALRKIFLGRFSTLGLELHPSKTCPNCGSQLARETGAAAAQADWHCPNPDCPPQVLKHAVLWASPKAMDIQGCDEKVVTQLVQRGLVRDASEFYRLKLGEIAALDGMTKERAQQIFDAITVSMKREPWRVLVGLGIPNVGVTEAQAFCKRFVSLDALFVVGCERLAKMDGITETMARSLTHWYGDPVNRKVIKRLEKIGVNFKC